MSVHNVLYSIRRRLLDQPLHNAQLDIQQVQGVADVLVWAHQFIIIIGKSAITLGLRFLQLFKWRDESGARQQLRIIESISSQWQDLAIFVGLNMSQMDGIKQESLMETEQCCLHVFNRWIISNGTTDYPTTWSGLHNLLKDIEHRALAKKMKTALQTVGIDISEEV